MLKIDKVTCLCLPDREENWSQLEAQIKEKGWNYERFLAGKPSYSGPLKLDYVDVENPDVSRWGYGREGFKHHHWNAFQCHHEMLRRATKEGVENLLILEDDAYITDRFDKVFAQVPENLEYDILYLGWWIGDENDQFNKKIESEYAADGIIRIYKVGQLGGLHGALINRRMFRFILGMPANNPIDCQLNYNHPNLNTWYVAPKIIHTRSMLSVCEGSVINRNHL